MIPEKLGPWTKIITREQLIRYAAASGDFNPIHYDTEIAKQYNLPGVIVHGMLNMGLFDNLLTPLYAQGFVLKEFSARFRQIVRPNESLIFSGTVKRIDDETLHVALNIQVSDADKPAVIGQAILRRLTRQS
ncbi:MaoC/PaaZ C-terminal domain-containing protein [Sulfobacillus thermosulfidooxidans]|uniref:MaoC/PaaZ C-terminal domain-containing protein n=1 Tax=Sulfobacillus thermosulfidooxidans TaxID=28034 RepID=UPI0006B64080|nr:MaoC/PaaZ C-terminal domain-containing protein [Sulfobacillus thermosulfidooxidans]